MAEFTKEQRDILIKTAEYMVKRENTSEYSENIRKVAEIALAALTAGMAQEPVIIVGDDGGDALAYRRLIQGFAPGTKLYAAPQLPQPAVLTNSSREYFEAWARGAGFNENWYFFTNTHPNHYDDDHINDMWAAWNACRAAMLQGAEPDFREIVNSSTNNCRENVEASTKCPCCGRKPLKNRACSVDGCDGKHVARGFCIKHYAIERKKDPSRRESIRAADKRYRARKAAAPQQEVK